MDEKRVLETSKGNFYYTTINLLKQVEENPVIWNRRHEDFKKSEARDEVWNGISRNFVPCFDELDEGEKQSIHNALLARWSYCKKGLMESVNFKRKNNPKFRPFTYAREMKFFLKQRGVIFSEIFNSEDVDGIDESMIEEKSQDEDLKTKDVSLSTKRKKSKITQSSVTFRSARLQQKQNIVESRLHKEQVGSPKNTIQKTNKPATPSDDVSVIYEREDSTDDDEESIEEIMEEELPHKSPSEQEQSNTQQTFNHAINNTSSSTQNILNESDAADEAFFESIKPALKKINETQKLDFQLDVLQLLKTFCTK